MKIRAGLSLFVVTTLLACGSADPSSPDDDATMVPTTEPTGETEDEEEPSPEPSDIAPDDPSPPSSDPSPEEPPGEPPSEEPPPEEDPGSNVSVMTMNLWNAALNREDYQKRTELVIAEIDRTRPDLVAVQENVTSGDIDERAAVIAEATGYEMVSETTHEVPFVFEEGIAVLSRRPVEEVTVSELPHRDLAVAQRKALTVTVTTPQGAITLIATHMMVDPDPRKKVDQARALLDAAPDLDHPVFLAGDLNAEPDSDAMRLLRGELEVDGAAGPFRDAWLETRGEDPGFTNPSDDPDKRIDYVYFAGESVVARHCERVLTEPVDGVRASDHVGVTCDFTL